MTKEIFEHVMDESIKFIKNHRDYTCNVINDMFRATYEWEKDIPEVPNGSPDWRCALAADYSKMMRPITRGPENAAWLPVGFTLREDRILRLMLLEIYKQHGLSNQIYLKMEV